MFDISIVSAFLAGLLSFVSPCILPIVPFYLSYLAGVGMNQISSDSEIDSATRRRAVLAAMFFAAGVITIFMGLGAAATGFGQVVREYFDILRWVAAASSPCCATSRSRPTIVCSANRNRAFRNPGRRR